MICEKCGAQLDDNVNFCTKCGEPVNKNKKLIETDFDVPIGQVVQQEGSSAKTGLIIALAALIVVMLGAIGVGAYLIISGNNGSGYTASSKNKDKDDDDDDDDKSDDDESQTQSEEETTTAAETDMESATTEETETLAPYEGVRTNVDINVRQVDTVNFPEISLYANVTDSSTNEVVEGLDKNDFVISEISNGITTEATLNDVYKVVNSDNNINVNLVMDASGSMSDSNKMTQAKNAAKSLLNSMDLSDGDKVEVISFDDYVYMEQEFTNNRSLLENAINSITPDGSTALYDALYSGLYQTYYEAGEGAKSVIGFTDGANNASSYTADDVVYLSRNTGIPVYIICIGGGYATSELEQMATSCSGKFYTATDSNLESVLSDIYQEIYQEQQDYYVMKYITKNVEDRSEFRNVDVETSQYSAYSGYYRKEYIPDADTNGAFSDDYSNKDYMITDSSSRTITEADLAGMSLAQLRIARNEIFARHGRQFRDSALNQWFYSKSWYLNIGAKYSPDYFDTNSPNPLSKLESDNANFIKAYEDNIMATQDIYPDASYTLLSEYDLALSKTVLKTALAQMQTYPSTSTLEQNIRLVQEAIEKEDVQYNY